MILENKTKQNIGGCVGGNESLKISKHEWACLTHVICSVQGINEKLLRLLFRYWKLNFNFFSVCTTLNLTFFKFRTS